MIVVIAAKTRMWDGVCIGGINEESGELIRLLPKAGAHGWPKSTMIEVGDIWQVRATPVECNPPHVEDYVVNLEEKVGEMRTMRAFVTNRHDPWIGDPHVLFDGLIRFTARGRGFISKRYGVPRNSVGFWMSPSPLKLVMIYGKPYYTAVGITPPIAIKYVGVGKPEEELPAGRVIRLSLARWWSPTDAPNMELRCYLQLSGWYSDEAYESRAQVELLTVSPTAKPEEVHDDYGDDWVEYDSGEYEEEDWHEEFSHYDDYNPWEDNDNSWGGMFISGSDDPPGEIYGSDFGDDSSDDALRPWGFYSTHHDEEDEDQDYD